MGLFSRNKRRRPRSRLVTVGSYRPTQRARRDNNPLQPHWRRAFLLGFGVLMIYLLVSGQMGLWRSVSLWKLRSQLDSERLQLSAEVVDLETRRRLLTSDTLYIEQVARTEYHMSRPDEIIYELNSNDQNPDSK